MHQSWDKVKFIFCLSGLTAPKFDIRLCIGQNPFSIFLISFMSQFKMKISIYNCCTSCSNNNLSEFHQIMWTWSGCLVYCFCIFIQKQYCVFIECVKIYCTNCNKTKYFRLLQYDKFQLLSLSLIIIIAQTKICIFWAPVGDKNWKCFRRAYSLSSSDMTRP